MSSYSAPSLRLPWLTPAVKRLLLVNAAVFLLNAMLQGRLSSGTAWFAFSWDRLWEGYGLGLLRIISYQFTHSFEDVWHLLGNMLTLYFFGTMVEPFIGYRGLYKLYLTGGIAGALLYLALAAPQGYGNVPMVGASGACFAILVYAAFMSPYAMCIFLPLWVVASALVFAGVYTSYAEFVSGMRGGVAHGAHVGGAAWGMVVWKRRWFRDHVPFAYQDSWWRSLRSRLRKWRAHGALQSEMQHQKRLDEILEKVGRIGMGSLTQGERRFLKKSSDRAKRQ